MMKNLLCDEKYIVQKIEDNYYKKKGLSSIIENLKTQRFHGETATEAIDSSPQLQASKLVKKRRMERTITNNNNPPSTPDYHNNNNHVKNERLSPSTPDVSSRSRSVTPSSNSHPDTPPADSHPLPPVSGRNYSDFMRSLAAKYNNTNPNDYFSAARNGFPPPLDPRFKSNFPNLLPSLPKEAEKKSDFSSLLNPFANTSMFPPLIDMSTTQTLLAMVRTAKEAELQGLLKSVKRQDASSPLDLSAAAPPLKRPRMKTSSSSSPSTVSKRAQSESPRLHEDVSSWTVDDVCNFVSSIDICAEYAQNFRDQRIDGSGLPLLTEEHLTTTMNMKLGPALKLRSLLAKKIGSCSVCLHCTHCHNSTGSPEPSNTAGNTSDSGGAS
ncbi:uncharacterized protein Samuel isoform X1 [Tribolium castaneum]|uniref:uncharacterized protein Samuel isoform X1 n=1 Tax=Tribolium castaneum TaxID=7070 RepID=UPI00077DD043|nr:PREDICTED: uncharacterized protein LOC103314119 isoform X2 [Tribolium castaneum]|eukprot:XP_015838502.1 PREDICTED: uncharacterized protein LOC103314119 isoform X2 [Tribolium castaneum]